MHISSHIFELLQTHDCVIVPALGGFLAQRKSAVWGNDEVLSPPSRIISFNARLTGSDGLLIHYVSSKGKVTYIEATKQVEKYVVSAKNLLAQGEDVNIDRVGKLNLDEEGNLQFIPQSLQDFFPSGFALRSFTAKPVEKQKEVVVEHPKLIPQQAAKQKTISFKRARRVRNLRKYVNYAALLLLLFAIGTAGIINYTGNNANKQLSEATLAPVIDSFTEIETNETSSELVEVKDAIDVVNESSTPAENKPEEIAPVFIESTEPQKGYYIIVGAFSKEENADALYNRLNNDFDSQIPLLRTKRNNLTAVGFYASKNYREAVSMLSNAKEKQSSAWLLKM